MSSRRGRRVATWSLGLAVPVCLVALWVFRDTVREGWGLRSLASPDRASRKAGAALLGGVASERSRRELLANLRTESVEDVRVESVLALVRQGSEAVRLLLEAYQKGRLELSTQVVYSLGRLEEDGAAALPLLEEFAHSRKEEYVRAAMHTLKRMGRPGVPALIRCLSGGTRDHALLHEPATNALIRIGPDVLPRLLEAVEKKEPVICDSARRRIVLALGRRSTPALVTALQRENEVLRDVVLDLLCELKGDGAGAAPVLVRLLGSDDPAVRDKAAKALGKVGVGSNEVLRSLSRLLLGDDVSTVREAAGRALGRIRPDSTEPVRALVRALDDPDTEVRKAVVMALGRIGEPSQPAVPALARVLRKDDVAAIREEAAKSLGRIGPGAAEAVPALIEAVRLDGTSSAVDDIREEAVEALGAIGAKAAVPALREAVEDKDNGVRKRARASLQLIDG